MMRFCDSENAPIGPFFISPGQSYNPEATKDAWAKTLGWFDKYLRA